MIREITPELLDTLPHDCPEALASRRDLRIINRLMNSTRWFERAINKLSSSQNCLEIGAGDGWLASTLVARTKIGNYTALDQIPRPKGLSKEIDWLQKDLFEPEPYRGKDCLIANLILHHFTDEALRELGSIIRNSTIQSVLISEPARRGFHKYQLAAGRLIGFNHVTLHDGRVSIEAGFLDNELVDLLELRQNGWKIQITQTFMGCHRIFATRS